jgi:hypothetical protein
MKKLVKCDFCEKEIMRKPTKTNTHFCDNECKGKWQILQREKLGYTKEWLEEEYLNKKRSADDIAKEIGRNSKRVWEWITDYGIPTRPRGNEYNQGYKKGDQARLGIRLTDAQKENLRQKCIERGSNPSQINGMHWMKYYGRKSPAYKGGTSPERQALYSSEEWALCIDYVWKRDNSTCQRCKTHQDDNPDSKLHIHHVISFNYKPGRLDVDNLLLLCRSCHLWVHDIKNKGNIFLKENPDEC